jgi:amphi-Trp domain-containing protein
LTEGFSAGTLKFSDRDGEIVLEPNGLVTIEVRASRSRNQVRLKLNFSWKDGTGEDSGKAPLLINGHHD